MKKLKVGIIGCGTIGNEIAASCMGLLKDKVELKALYDIDRKKAEGLSRLIKRDITVDSMDMLFDKADLIVESASAGISRKVVEKAVEKSKDVMIMSIGGLIQSEGLLKEAGKKNIRVYFPSGAVCGIDGLKAARLSGIESVTLTTRKPPGGLEGAPYLKEKNINVHSIKGEKVLFRGNPLEAVKGFPKNINVASVLSLAGIGAKKTKVRIITSPGYTKNVHEIEITGDFGSIRTRTENVPSRKNPKTSALAILSAIATLKGIVESIKIGT
ncbi:MAG: aspartate dehydrogenase [Candidatus Omnitrophota bacterium]|nr:MAG: aspartate dehydrogenase [Candidatus Omnitrophota bacterium]